MGLSPLAARVQKLIRQAKSKKTEVRELAIGELLGYLQRGIPRKQVEAWLGPPDKDIVKDHIVGGVGDVLYYCRPPGSKQTELMTIDYDLKGTTPRFLRVRGPHYPGERKEEHWGEDEDGEVRAQLSPLSARVQKLIRQARSNNTKARERAVGELLPYLQRGMIRKQVEAWLGPPDEDMDWRLVVDDVGHVVYRCRPPGAKKVEAITVHYNVKEKPSRLVQVRGPRYLRNQDDD
jgi:hypothetical protein